MTLATTLEFTPGDKKWTALRQKALSDLYFFASTVLGYGDLIPMRPLAHAALCKFLARQTGVPDLDEANVRLILQPRELGKSTLARAYVIQRLMEDPNRSYLICSETATLATAILGSIKQELLGNELLRALFPEIIPKDESDTTMWKAEQINLKRTTTRPEPSLFVGGVDKAITGFHPDGIVTDDMVGREAAENARVGDRGKTYSLHGWVKTLVPIVNKNAKPRWELLFIGTNWFYGDPYTFVEEFFGRSEPPTRYRMKQRLDDGQLHTTEVYRKGDLAVMRRAALEHGRSIFPEKWDIEKLAQMRVADPQGFACFYMNNPSDEVTQVFKDSWVGNYDRVDRDIYRVIGFDGKPQHLRLADLDVLIAVDPGGFGAKGGAGRMRPAIVVTGTTRDDRHLVLEAWSEPETYEEAAQQVITLIEQYQPRKVIVERAGQQVMFIDLVKNLASKARLLVPFAEYKPDARVKAQRILVLESFFQNGQILVGTGPTFAELREQIRTFPNGARVDVLDALHMLAHHWRRPGHPAAQGSMESRKQRELNDYLTRRGLR